MMFFYSIDLVFIFNDYIISISAFEEIDISQKIETKLSPIFIFFNSHFSLYDDDQKKILYHK